MIEICRFRGDQFFSVLTIAYLPTPLGVNMQFRTRKIETKEAPAPSALLLWAFYNKTKQVRRGEEDKYCSEDKGDQYASFH